MEEKEIIEGNKLIAEFDGWEKTKHEDEELGNLYIKYGESKYADSFRYELSWDWLMPVIHKFKYLTQTHYLMFEAECTKQHIEHKKSIDLMLSLAGIEEVWKTLVDGIKWHNSQTAAGCSAKWDSK